MKDFCIFGFDSNNMRNELKILTFITLLLFLSCKQSSENKTEYNQNRELIPNPEGLQKDNLAVLKVTNEDCKCGENDITGTKTDTVYKLSNGKRIALCGYRNIENKPINFSEFVLSVCGEKNIIDFWDATQTCNLRTKNDTLIVEEIIDLPTKKDRNYETNIWLIVKIYFENNKVIKKHFINKNIKRYSEKEIAKTLNEYENADEKIDDRKMELLNRLFISTISENKKAREYFYKFKDKYKIDGAFSEEYNDLKAMLEVWDKQK